MDRAVYMTKAAELSLVVAAISSSGGIIPQHISTLSECYTDW